MLNVDILTEINLGVNKYFKKRLQSNLQSVILRAMKSNIKQFKRYIAFVGGVTEASQRLKCHRSTLYHVLNGIRGISKGMAEKIEKDSKGLIKKEKLIWG